MSTKIVEFDPRDFGLLMSDQLEFVRRLNEKLLGKNIKRHPKATIAAVIQSVADEMLAERAVKQ